MENFVNQDSGYQQVTETLFQTFGQVFSEDVISAIVESCGGDLNESANAIMNMTEVDMESQDNVDTLSLSHNVDSNGTDQDAATSNDNISDNYQNLSDQLIPTQNNTIQSYANTTAQPAQRYLNTDPGDSSKYFGTGARSRTEKPNSTKNDVLSIPQIRNILSQHAKGHRILIIMRGAPGSGKSYLAKKIIEETVGPNPQDFKTHILSTDDYFMFGRAYNFDKSKLHDAHEWNQKRAKDCMTVGLSPVIIDNTNITMWEIEPYVKIGLQNGYLIEVVEPNTPWAKRVHQLAKKNIHGVPIQSIKRMLENYEKVTCNDIMVAYKLSYPPNMLPPVLRNIPPVELKPLPVQTVSDELKQLNVSEELKQTTLPNDSNIPSSKKDNNNDLNVNEFDQYEDTTAYNEPYIESRHDAKSNTALFEQYTEIQKQSEEFAKVEHDWDQGEPWYDDSQTTSLKNIETTEEQSKPQRKCKNHYAQQKSINTDIKSNFSISEEYKTDDYNLEQTPTSGSRSIIKKSNDVSGNGFSSNAPNCSFEGNLTSETETNESMSNVQNFLVDCQDWTKISMFMPPWETESKSDDCKPTIVVEKVDSSTCVEIDDTNIIGTNKPYKLLSATARDINLYYVPIEKEKIPLKRMLDKSSMTNEPILSQSFRCKNSERHFKRLRKEYKKKIKKAALRDLFEHCNGDVNWLSNLLLDGWTHRPVLNAEDSSSEDSSDDEITEGCECMAAYNIIPDIHLVSGPITNSDETEEIASESTPKKQRKSKKDISASESSVQLKRQIEKNVVIPDSHYSDNVLKVRKLRRGELNKNKSESINNDTQKTDDFVIPSTSKVDIDASSSYSEDQVTNTQSKLGDDSDDGNTEKIVNFDLGNVFVSHLDKLYGRSGYAYPSYVLPKINIPISLLNEINTLWIESLLEQSNQSKKQTELMIKQDEEFATQLALKEAEMAQAGKEPEVPDFKEIMDMEYALSLYQKDVKEEWRNKEPQDLAAKLTRDKLSNLFPDIAPVVLSELLMAHDNNFRDTLEGLLMSTGRNKVLETENGVNKFVMEKELERQKKIIDEQKKKLSEFDWPSLPKGKNIEMSVVEEYRREADMCLKKERCKSYQKAREYISRGMTQVAVYYSEVADLHTRKFEYANCVAAAYLIQAHASNNPDDSFVDLHYLRVGEALESLDLFLDSHIQRLREAREMQISHLRCRTLFFVTGRGLHSARGQPRIKPATEKRLKERGIAFKEINPGLLSAKVYADTYMSSEVA